jgi:broad specificity phosphatase PhoE
MAEEVLDQVLTGDPVPKPGLPDTHRAKLDSIVQKMIANKESDDNIKAVVNDFKTKYSQQASVQSSSVQPAFQVQLSEPTFKSTPLTTAAREFQDTSPSQATDIYKLQGKARIAQDALHTELQNNKAALGRVVAYDRLKSQEEKRKLGLPTGPEDFNVNITDEDVNKVAEEAKGDQHRASQVLSAAVEINPEKDTELQKNKYYIAAYNDASSDPNGNERVAKIEENAKKIGKGDLTYKNGTLGKPEGFFGSLVSARNELNRLSDAYDYTKKMQSEGNEAGVIMELNNRMKRDPDQPISIPTGAMGHLAANIGGMPIKGMAAGVVASAGTTLLGNPEAAPAAFDLASAGVNANDMYKIGHQNALEQNYVRIKSAHPEMPDYTAYKQAGELADKQAIVDAASAAAMQYLGSKVGFGAAKQLTKGITSGLSEVKDELGKKAVEALGVGGIGAGGQVVKNIMAQKAGLNVPTTEGGADQFTTGVLMTGAMSMLGLGQTYLKNATKTKIASGLAKLPDNVVDEGLNRVQQAGHLTPEQVENVKNIIKEQKILESTIPEDLPETDRLKIGAKIKERSGLKQQLETVDEAYHPELKERVKKLNEEILNISKGSERGELQSLVHKEIKAGNVEWAAVEVLRHAGEGELKQYMNDIAEQAHDPATEQSTIDTFGESIVNKAKELYPKKEAASMGEVPEEKVGAVEITEHGEDTKTAAGQENGIQPSKLSEEGIKEAKELGKDIAEKGKTKIITSEVERAGETADEAAKEAKTITGKDIPVEKNKVLNTWDIGQYDGKPEGSFVEEAWVNKPSEAPQGGESFNDFTKRMEQAYEYVKSLPEDNHVVTHSKVMRALDALSKTEGKWTEETTKEFLNNKELTHAIQEPSTSGLLQHAQEGIGETGSERGGMEPGQQGEGTSETRAQEKDNDKGQKEVAKLSVDEAYGLPFIEEPGDRKTGIKNAITKAIRFERKLPEIELPKMGSDEDILQLGKDLVDSGKINPLEIVNRIIDTEGGMQPDEAAAMQYYMHQLDKHEDVLRSKLAEATDDLEKSNIIGQLQQLSDELDAATQADIISGNAWHRVGETRQISVDTGFNPSREKAFIKEAYGGQIPKDVQARLDRVLKERNEALNKLAKLQAEEKNKAAENTIKKEGAPKNTKKSKEEFKNERTEIKKSISDKLKKGRTGEGGLTAVPLPFAKELITITPDIFKLVKSFAEEGVQKTEEVINRLHDILKDELEGITKADIVNLLAGRYKPEGENVSKLSQRIRDFRTEANLWTKIAEATKMEEDTPVKKQEKNKKLQDLRDRLNDIRKKNNEAIAEAKDILTTDAQREIKKLQQRRKGLETRYKNKKYLLPAEATKTPLSEEILKEKQRIINANYKIRIEKRKAFESQKNFYQKSLMWVGRLVRLSVLSGYNVLAKLGSAAIVGGAAKRIPEQAIGFIYGHAFKGIAEKAPIEGFVNASAEAKLAKEFFNPKKFAVNTWQILKSGESHLSKKFSPGTHEHIPILYLATDLHQVIKDPLKRGVYEASLKNAMVWAERNGMDINDDLVIQSLETAAYKRAQYEIFQEQNWLSKKFGEFKSNLEQSGNWGATGKLVADIMIPISTVPTNIARRMVSTSPFGLLKGSVKVIEAYRKGIESLTPEEADSVMRQLKQGTLGTALWMIGWYGYSQFGGLYSKFNPNKSRDEGDMVSDEMAVGGEMIPKPVQHALPLEIIQFAATARRVYDNYKENKGASTAEAIEKAGLASIGALTEQIPVIEEVAHTIGAFNNPYEAKKLEEDVRRRFEPQILRETGVIGKDKGGSGGGAGASGKYSKPTKQGKPHKTHR